MAYKNVKSGNTPSSPPLATLEKGESSKHTDIAQGAR